MKRILQLAAILMCFVLDAQAQQIEQYTQYMFNPQVLNPAAAGRMDYTMLRFNYRVQWAGGFNGDEPKTQLLTFSMKPGQSQNVGLGALIFNDQTGPTRRTGIELDYAYHVPLGVTSTKLGLGIGGTVLQYSVDFDRLETEIPDDPAIIDAVNNKIGADAKVGAYLHDKRYYVGASVAQLFQSKFVFGADTSGFIKLDRHIFILAGYKYDLSDEIQLEPSVLLKSVGAAPVQFDLNARLIYDQNYWLGFNYRTSDAISVLAGLTFNDQWHLGYSFDFPTSEIRLVSNGSHEVMLGIDFGRQIVQDYKSSQGTKF